MTTTVLSEATRTGRRAVQPVLLEIDRDGEEAAVSLGASSATTFRTVVLPALGPAPAPTSASG